jgi:hypothetical protein
VPHLLFASDLFVNCAHGLFREGVGQHLLKDTSTCHCRFLSFSVQVIIRGAYYLLAARLLVYRICRSGRSLVVVDG